MADCSGMWEAQNEVASIIYAMIDLFLNWLPRANSSATGGYVVGAQCVQNHCVE